MQSITPARTSAELHQAFSNIRELNSKQIMRAKHFVQNYAIARRCIEEYEKMLGIPEATILFVNDMDTVADLGGVYTELHTYLYEKFVVPVLKSAVVNYLQYGFTWFCTQQVAIDASIDPAWMNQYKHIKDKAKQPYKTYAYVPVCPDVSELNFYSCSNTGSPPIICALFKEETKLDIPLLNVVVWKQPDHATGTINSPCASVLGAYYRLLRMEITNVVAAIALANPVTITEFYKSDGAQGDLHTHVISPTMATSAGYIVDPASGQLNPAPEKSPTQLEYIKMMQQEINDDLMSAQTSYTSAMANVVHMLDDDAITNENYMRYVPQSATRLATLPPQQRVGGQPRAPVPPVNLESIQTIFRAEVAASFGIPMSRLSFQLPRMASTQEALDQGFIATMEAFSRSLSEVAAVVYAAAFGSTVQVSFPLHVGMPPIEILVQLVQAEVLTPQEVAESIRQTQGLSGSSVRAPTRVTVLQASSQNRSKKRKLHSALADHSLLFPKAAETHEADRVKLWQQPL